jgi:hypothetical protein
VELWKKRTDDTRKSEHCNDTKIDDLPPYSRCKCIVNSRVATANLKKKSGRVNDTKQSPGVQQEPRLKYSRLARRCSTLLQSGSVGGDKELMRQGRAEPKTEIHKIPAR